MNTLEQDRRLLIPLREATYLIGCKDTRVTSRLIAEGKLKAKNQGKRVYIKASSLREYVGA